MRALYWARVDHGLCPGCEDPVASTATYCVGCRADRADANRTRRYLTSLRIAIVIADTTCAYHLLSSCVVLTSSVASGPPN